MQFFSKQTTISAAEADALLEKYYEGFTSAEEERLLHLFLSQPGLPERYEADRAMSQLSETFPTLDCSQCILTPRMVEVAQHPNITLYTYAELEHLDGFIGNFKATIRLKAKSVDYKLCTGCGACTTKCPNKKIPSEFNEGLGMRTAIYTPFPQAVPNKPVIDRANCTYYQKGKCKVCEKVCPTGAIQYDRPDQFITEDIGAVVIATGFNVLKTDFFPEYGYGKYADVLTGLQFERLASASGPTLGEIRRPSDGKVPRKIVFIACSGSRDPAKGIPYCSKICCMYTAKHGTKGKRLRCWDSCGFALFTLHTSGHNPRQTQAQRWRQRLLHKFSYMRGSSPNNKAVISMSK